MAMTRQEVERKQVAAAVGGVTGLVVGAAGYVLHTRRLGPPALGAGAFMGIVFAVGSAMRTR